MRPHRNRPTTTCDAEGSRSLVHDRDDLPVVTHALVEYHTTSANEFVGVQAVLTVPALAAAARTKHEQQRRSEPPPWCAVRFARADRTASARSVHRGASDLDAGVSCGPSLDDRRADRCIRQRCVSSTRIDEHGRSSIHRD
jgi:hypothetical protein